MATSSTLAFGQYLRTLRERRGLSLDDVATLSRTFADPVEKGYLSRCENGHQSLALSKMIALSRIYEVPAEVLVDRLELDLEVERFGGPDTTSLGFKELTDLGVAAMRTGTKWDAYAYFRDAVPLAGGSLIAGFRDLLEQSLCATMNLSSAAASLNRNALALAELSYIQSAEGLSPEYEPLLHDKLSRLHRAKGDLVAALKCADLAVALSESGSATRYLGYALDNRARLAGETDDLEGALRYYQRAFDAYTSSGREAERATALLCIGDVYFRMRRYSASRRALAAAQEVAVPLGRQRTLAHIQLTLGDLALANGQVDHAAAHWRNGLHIAHTLRDHELKFRAEFRLYRKALEDHNLDIAEPLARRLRKLSPWVPSEIEELKAFRTLYTPPRAKRRQVARSQRTAS
ncbi:MAG TPA: helix-turn-helix transcriptional regulator [Candidatus Polarisedimenticolaceae bacterium]|nr:helix-turn-helix transcriptional regulator [Candidatus Polarisedimenticolaceae bacterium]